MDLTVETKQYIFTACYSFDYVLIYLINNMSKSEKKDGSESYYYLTKKEVRNLIEYLKQDNYGDERDFWIVDRLISMEMLMEGKEKATFHFW